MLMMIPIMVAIVKATETIIKGMCKPADIICSFAESKASEIENAPSSIAQKSETKASIISLIKSNNIFTTIML